MTGRGPTTVTTSRPTAGGTERSDPAPRVTPMRTTTTPKLRSRLRQGSRLLRAVLPALVLPALGGCNIRQYAGLDMYDQPKVYTPYEASDFFEDKLSARPLVAGTIPRREVYADRSSVGVEPLKYAGDAFPPGFPTDGPELKKVLENGQLKYNIYCSVCHGQTGLGDGMIVQRGFSRPPSFVVPGDEGVRTEMEKGDPYRWQRTEYMQTATPRHIHTAITNGFGAMYSYGERVADKDRWAIAAYIKALQSTPVEGMVQRPRPTATDKDAAK